MSRAAAGNWGWVPKSVNEIDLTQLATTDAPVDISWDSEAVTEVEPSPEDVEAHSAWVSRFDDRSKMNGQPSEAVCICSQGCGFFNVLVLSGPHRGQVWIECGYDLAPEPTQDGKLQTFATWYLTWLEGPSTPPSTSLDD